jgi:hypothetical protein
MTESVIVALPAVVLMPPPGGFAGRVASGDCSPEGRVRR